MARYQVNHRYRSNEYGPWDAKTFVELTEDEAAWVNHDSPGCLTEIDPDEQAAAKRKKTAPAKKTAAGEPAEPETKTEPDQTLVDGSPAKADKSSPALDKATKD